MSEKLEGVPSGSGLVLVGGTVIDGTGASAQIADVLIRDGLIHYVGAGASIGGASVRDVTGKVVCPGFVDIHTHSDLTLLSNPGAVSKVTQGVTTEVVGNCGLGVAPIPSGAPRADIRQAVSYLDLDPDVAWTWGDTAEYLAVVSGARTSLNVATLTAHLPLHAGVVGFDDRPATRVELDQMAGLLSDSFQAGSLGLSTGLVYAPLCYVGDPELAALGETVAAHDRVFTWHVRDYGDALIPSVLQALEIARRTGCRTQISHLTAVGRRNWGRVRQALALVDEAIADGLRIGVDIYPYLYGNAPLAQLLPSWAQEGGPSHMTSRLHDEETRNRVRAEWANLATEWEDITVSWVPEGHPAENLVGQMIASTAIASHTTGDDVALDLIAELGFAVSMVAGGRSEDDLRAVLDHPAAVVASDGMSLDPNGVTGAGSPHPRSYGCFPRFLSRYAGQSEAEFVSAIRKCTGAPADLLGITGRGLIEAGAAADIVVFSRDELADRATFAAPQLLTGGIDLVLVAGEVVVEAGDHTGSRPGTVIRR